MNKVIVSGADGFIGRNLVRGLVDAGIEVYAIVYPKGVDQVFTVSDPDKLHVIPHDLNDAISLSCKLPEDIDVLYHFAWNGVRPELRNDLDIQMGNIGMTINCMKMAIKSRTKRIVFPGSTNEYLYYGKPINRDAVPSPNNAYGAVKIALRYLCANIAAHSDIDFIYTIIAGIYAEDRRDNNVIFYTIDKLLHKEKPMLTELEQRWDYVHIDDVIRALIKVGDKGNSGEVYAIGHGDNWELKNYIRIIHEKIDPCLPLGIGEIPYDSDILPCSCIDLTAIKRDCGFEPQVSFEKGIEKVINKLKDELDV